MKPSIIIKMKNVIFFSVVLLFVGCNNNIKIDSEMVWSNYLKNFGDSAKINNVKTIRYTSEYVHEGIITGTSEVILKGDNKIKITFKSPEMVIVTKFDGENFIRRTNDKITEVPIKDRIGLKRMCDFFHEVYYKKHGFKVELIGMGKIDNVDVYKVKYFFKDMISYYYIDTKNFNVVKIESDYGEFWPIEIKELDGIRYFSKYKTIDPYTTAFTNVRSMEINPEVNDSIFK